MPRRLRIGWPTYRLTADGGSYALTGRAATLTPVTGGSGTVDLTWTASVSTPATGYRVYYGTSPGTYSQTFGSGISVGNVTSYQVTGLTASTTYYFAVTAIDGSGESAYSAEDSAVA